MAPRVSKVPVRRQYTELDKWRAYNHYVTTGWFTKKTARELYLSVSTVRSWVKTWDFDADGHARNPPQTPTQDEIEEIQEEGDDLAQYESLKHMAMARLREVIPKTNSPDQLIRVFKELSDRIDRAKGISGGDVLTTPENNSRLAAAHAAGAGMISELVRRSVEAAEERSAHIIDMECESQDPPALPSGDGGVDDA
jgi:transposase-like protein